MLFGPATMAHEFSQKRKFTSLRVFPSAKGNFLQKGSLKCTLILQGRHPRFYPRIPNLSRKKTTGHSSLFSRGLANEQKLGNISLERNGTGRILQSRCADP